MIISPGGQKKNNLEDLSQNKHKIRKKERKIYFLSKKLTK